MNGVCKIEVAVTCIFLFRFETLEYKLRTRLNKQLIYGARLKSRKKIDPEDG